MTLQCITNDMPDVRACTTRDAHTPSCNSWEYRLVTTRYDKQGHPVYAHIATGKPCKGCLPRPAKVGLLCMTCWLNLEQALADWPRFEQMIRGVDRAVRGDGGGRSGREAGYVPLPGTQLAVEECLSYLNDSAWADARTWVSRDAGARNAVLFTHAAQVAYRSHPIEEAPRKLRRVRCPKCGQLSFVRNPPASALAPVTVRCQNTACGKTIREGDTTTAYDHVDDNGDPQAVEKLVVIAEIERHRA